MWVIIIVLFSRIQHQMLPGSNLRIITGIVLIPSRLCLFQIRGKNSILKNMNLAIVSLLVFCFCFNVHSQPCVHLKTHLCIVQPSCCSVLIRLSCEFEGMVGNGKNGVTWLKAWLGSVRALCSYMCPNSSFQQIYLCSHSCTRDQLRHCIYCGSFIWGVHWP